MSIVNVLIIAVPSHALTKRLIVEAIDRAKA